MHDAHDDLHRTPESDNDQIHCTLVATISELVS